MEQPFYNIFILFTFLPLAAYFPFLFMLRHVQGRRCEGEQYSFHHLEGRESPKDKDEVHRRDGGSMRELYTDNPRTFARFRGESYDSQRYIDLECQLPPVSLNIGQGGRCPPFLTKACDDRLLLMAAAIQTFALRAQHLRVLGGLKPQRLLWRRSQMRSSVAT
ncbi:hypothetical protein EJ08DRAFT_499011 [Tothia fuscella]|uniref:Uncharacterized protein n=1 Tax=Tothia fuscella TaxID=1048955 RepID=A0A9P4NXM4_9PEZI|nr:hypothetical protein EJ08DRAFT_499011 [Tothia fuscella]